MTTCDLRPSWEPGNSRSRLGRYLNRVRLGDTIVVTNRSEPSRNCARSLPRGIRRRRRSRSSPPPADYSDPEDAREDWRGAAHERVGVGGGGRRPGRTRLMLFVDASALVKRYVRERHSVKVRDRTDRHQPALGGRSPVRARAPRSRLARTLLRRHDLRRAAHSPGQRGLAATDRLALRRAGIRHAPRDRRAGGAVADAEAARLYASRSPRARR